MIQGTSKLALSLMTLGGLWLCLWQRRWRLFGLAGVAAAIITIPYTNPPDIYVTEDAKLIGIRGKAANLWLTSNRAGKFAREMWMRQSAIQTASKLPNEGLTPDGFINCSEEYCVIERPEQNIFFSRDKEACLIIELPNHKLITINNARLAKHGAHAIWLQKDRIPIIKTVRAEVGNRPWTIKRPI